MTTPLIQKRQNPYKLLDKILNSKVGTIVISTTYSTLRTNRIIDYRAFGLSITTLITKEMTKMDTSLINYYNSDQEAINN